jgi:hypothetical protein
LFVLVFGLHRNPNVEMLDRPSLLPIVQLNKTTLFH